MSAQVSEPQKSGEDKSPPKGMSSSQWEVAVDAENKCTEFKPFIMAYGVFPVPHCGRRRRTNPHMRGFWAATLCFMFAFIGWFAFAPIMTRVRMDIGLCDNDEVVQAALKAGDEDVKCSCKPGGQCKKTLADAKIASVSFDIFVRFILGAVLERVGPVLTDTCLMLIGCLFVLCSATIQNGTGLIVVRFFVSCLGATFVVNQFWTSLLFNRSVVGTANATAGGWGNLGGGLTQVIMPFVLEFFNKGLGIELHWAWRLSMLFPAAIFIFTAVFTYCMTQDTPSGKFSVGMLGKSTKAGPLTYLQCLKDYRIALMIFQYGACFGCELVMNNTLASHFGEDYFGVELKAAGAMALTFGGMNLFARSLGGLASDWANVRWGMCGRLWVHFLALFFQAVFLFLFGCVNKDLGWGVALAVLVPFAIFVNMAEGTSYAIVPYMRPQDLAVVSALVGAGGTLGAVITTFAFYKYTEDELRPFKLHGFYVMFWALTVPLMRWSDLGSMFSIAQKPAASMGPAASAAPQVPGHSDDTI